MAIFQNTCSLEMDCPKEVVVWNYYDHEHVVGTHYKYYNHFKIIAERADWCLVERFYKLPIISLRASSVGFMWKENPNLYGSIQFGKLGTRLQQKIILDDLGPDRCKVISVYEMQVPFIFKPFEFLFKKITTRWFHATWEEDAPMRLRRWKVWKLGFQDFTGIDYINQKTAKPADRPSYRPYPHKLPVPKTPELIQGAGYSRPFSKSVELGY